MTPVRIGTLRDSLTGIADLLAPLRCAGCGAPGDGLCAECGAEIGGLRRVRRPLPDRQDTAVYALGRYRGAARRAVLAYKESGRRELAVPFGDRVAAALGTLVVERADLFGATAECYLVPAPSRPAKSRSRGGAHMARVGRNAAAAASVDGMSVTMADCLTLGRGVRDSVGLEPAQRLRNLSGRILLRPGEIPPPHAPVVLIDDVLTTGATATSCVGVLASARARVVAVLTLTATAA